MEILRHPVPQCIFSVVLQDAQKHPGVTELTQSQITLPVVKLKWSGKNQIANDKRHDLIYIRNSKGPLERGMPPTPLLPSYFR